MLGIKHSGLPRTNAGQAVYRHRAPTKMSSLNVFLVNKEYSE